MKVLVTGASGYVVVRSRSASSSQAMPSWAWSGPEKASLLKERRIDPLLGNLGDWRILSDAAQAADAVIHAASADDAGPVLTLIGALERTGKSLISTTGSAIVAESAGGEYASSVVFTEDTYFEPVPFRRPRVEMIRFVREASISKGIPDVGLAIHGRPESIAVFVQVRSTPIGV